VRTVISCRTLGPVEVSQDGGFPPAELLWRKNLALLLYLARSPRGRSREHLLGQFWADKPESAARHSLNEAVRVLRKVAGDEAVDTSGGRVRLAPGALQLDLDRLEAHAAREEWREAAELIAGEFLEGFTVPGASDFEEWLAAERTVWRRRGVEVLSRAAEMLLRDGQGPDAVLLARRAAALDTRSELGVRTLMRALALSGERTAALECWDQFVRRLHQELGAAPEAETAALAELIRRERASRPPSPNGQAASAGPRLPLAGRERELGRLLDVATACRTSRRAAAIVLEGDAGMGKTRLLEELLARLRLESWTVAAVRAVEADRDQPWSGLRTAARGGLLDAPGLAGAPASALAAFVAELPEWLERFPGAAGQTPLPPGRALGELLRAALEEQPVVLAVDDADCFDRESLLALIAALRDLASAPLLVAVAVAARRQVEGVDDLRSRLGHDLDGAAITLGPLDVMALQALARRMLPTFTEAEIDRVVRRVGSDSAGVPILAVELLRAVALGMDLGATSGAWPEPFKTLDQTLPGDLPDAVVAAIRVGFRRLSPAARQVLAAASILDPRVTPELLAQGTALALGETITALDELEWHRWMVSEPRGYSFVARVVRQVVARDMLTPGQRRRILERLGRSE
jgi:DNA-binding SARP family transcriptional activator